MQKELNTEGKIMAFATYKPHEGKENELMTIVKAHLPMLRRLGLASAKEGYLAQAMDGTIIEVFEWASPDAVKQAHTHPEVSKVWDEMTAVADFNPMNELQEAERPFPGFAVL
jgi:Mg2+/citrate symporter